MSLHRYIMLQSLEIQVLPFLKPHEFIVIYLGAGNGQKEVFNENDLCNYFLIIFFKYIIVCQAY